jgi:hypothetical protein
MEKLRMAKSAFEQASTSRAEVGVRTAVGLVYLTEALIDMNAELEEVKMMLNKARKDRNESSDRAKDDKVALKRKG